MSEIVQRLGENIVPLGGILAGVVAIIGGFTVAITQSVTAHRRRSQLDEMEATLKLEMIQRGMSAADIRTVLEAKMDSAGEPDVAPDADQANSRAVRMKNRHWGAHSA